LQDNPYSQAKKCVTFIFLRDSRGDFYPIGTLLGKNREIPTYVAPQDDLTKNKNTVDQMNN